MCVRIMFGTHFYFCFSLRNIVKPLNCFTEIMLNKSLKNNSC